MKRDYADFNLVSTLSGDRRRWVSATADAYEGIARVVLARDAAEGR